MPVPDANGCTVGSSRHASSSKPNRLHDLELERLLRARAGTSRGGVGSCRRAPRPPSRAAPGAPSGSRRAPHLGRRHAALVVVEHDVVRLVVVAVEAVDVAACAARGSCAGRAGTSRSRCPCAPRPRPGSRATAERDISARRSGRHLARLLPVAARDADQARLERVVVVLLARSRAGRRAGVPISGEVNFWCAMRPSVASCSARTRRRAAASSPAGPSRGARRSCRDRRSRRAAPAARRTSPGSRQRNLYRVATTGGPGGRAPRTTSPSG